MTATVLESLPASPAALPPGTAVPPVFIVNCQLPSEPPVSESVNEQLFRGWGFDVFI